MSKLIKKEIAWSKMFHGIFWLIDDLCVINGCPKGLVLMLEHSGSHAHALDLDITIRYSQGTAILSL